MKKKSIALILALLCLLTVLSGCGGKKKLEPQTLADELLSSANFTDKLDKLDAPVIPLLYGLDTADYKDALVYAGTGATAEEIAIFEAEDGAAADRLLQAAKDHVDHRLEEFKNYGPAAAMTLQNAITAKSGNTVILVICSDSAAAQKIVDRYI